MNTKINPAYVVMTSSFRIKTDIEPKILDIGGFEVIVNEKTVPFDFESCSIHKIKKENGWIYYEHNSYEGPYFNSIGIDPCYDEEYTKLGFSREILTAEFLASATKITEYFCAFTADKNANEGEEVNSNNFELLEVAFENETESFSVKKAVIKDFNKHLPIK